MLSHQFGPKDIMIELFHDSKSENICFHLASLLRVFRSLLYHFLEQIIIAKI